MDGSTITMQLYEASRGPIRGVASMPQQPQHDRRSSWAEAPSFVPVQQQRYASFSGAMQPMGMPVPEAYHPIRRDFSNSSSSSSGSGYDLAGMAQVYKNAGSDAMVDPRNLFCKVDQASVRRAFADRLGFRTWTKIYPRKISSTHSKGSER